MADEISERQMFDRLAREMLDERRRARRWGIFFRLINYGLLFLFLSALVVGLTHKEKLCIEKCTALVEVRGELEASSRASAEHVISGLQAAFKNTSTKGIVVRVNSPGGSPVQAGQIYDEIRRLRAANPDKPLFAVVEDIAASGGYYVAAAADKIYVDKASLIGSIGVIMQSFGFTEAMQKIGVERRIIAAGENKSLLDPFTPTDPKQREYVQSLVNDIHQQFIASVKQGRGERLKETPEMFSGLVWNGARAIELGLADDLGSLDYVAREVIKAEEVVDFTPEDNIAERVARRFGAAMGAQLGAGWRGFSR